MHVRAENNHELDGTMATLNETPLFNLNDEEVGGPRAAVGALLAATLVLLSTSAPVPLSAERACPNGFLCLFERLLSLWRLNYTIQFERL
jgi:hypothetical protein